MGGPHGRTLPRPAAPRWCTTHWAGWRVPRAHHPGAVPAGYPAFPRPTPGADVPFVPGAVEPRLPPYDWRTTEWPFLRPMGGFIEQVCRLPAFCGGSCYRLVTSSRRWCPDVPGGVRTHTRTALVSVGMHSLMEGRHIVYDR